LKLKGTNVVDEDWKLRSLEMIEKNASMKLNPITPSAKISILSRELQFGDVRGRGGSFTAIETSILNP
jgi:hypothetical protein